MCAYYIYLTFWINRCVYRLFTRTLLFLTGKNFIQFIWCFQCEFIDSSIVQWFLAISLKPVRCRMVTVWMFSSKFRSNHTYFERENFLILKNFLLYLKYVELIVQARDTEIFFGLRIPFAVSVKDTTRHHNNLTKLRNVKLPGLWLIFISIHSSLPPWRTFQFSTWL